MTDRSRFQRLISELRRRRVPQTVAIYMVAAWAAIQFADVVVPNLNGPPWIVPAVIIAAAAGLPVVLVLAWIFEWGPEGIHRTGGSDEPSPPRAAYREWMTAVGVLVVGIASAVGAAAVIAGADGGAERTADRRPDRAIDDGTPMIPPAPPGIRSPEFADSLGSRAIRSLADLDSLDALLEWTSQLGQDSGLVVFDPGTWRFGGRAHPLARGDTLEVSGMAQDSAGVIAVEVDGRRVADADPPQPALPFTATVIGTGSTGEREVVITARTANGREVRHVFVIRQLPAS